jgi:hypothetical protein
MDLVVAALLYAVIVLVGAPGVATAAGQKQCVRACKQERRACLKKFKQQSGALKRACRSEASRREVASCRKAQQRAFRANKTQCKALFGDVCKPCCSEGGDECESSLASMDVAAGGAVESEDAGATAQVVSLTVTSPTPGRVAIVSTRSPAPPSDGLVPLGVQFLVEAPEATPEDPLLLAFDVRAARVPPNDLSLEVSRDGQIVTPCVRGSRNALPDPCVVRRDLDASHNVRILVRSSAGGTWTVAERVCGNGVLDAGEACDPPGSIGECAGCQICRAECVCEDLPPGECQPNASGGPDLAALTIVSGLDLDIGFTGLGHNQEFAVGSRAFFTCLQDCDLTTDPECTGRGPTGPGTLNGVLASSPFPVVVENIAVCINNEFAADIIVNNLNLATGELDSLVQLTTKAFLTGNRDRPCPTCSGTSVGAGGTCRAGPRIGQPCTTEVVDAEFGNTSADCPPSGADLTGALATVLPITTATTTLSPTLPCFGGRCWCPDQPTVNECTLGSTCELAHCPVEGPGEVRPGIDQACCPVGDEIEACFSGNITRQGQPAIAMPPWPGLTYPKISDAGRMTATFCVQETNSVSINAATGLPAPGAFIFEFDTCLDFAP